MSRQCEESPTMRAMLGVSCEYFEGMKGNCLFEADSPRMIRMRSIVSCSYVRGASNV